MSGEMSGGASGVARLDHALEVTNLGYDSPAIRPAEERKLVHEDAVEQLDVAGVQCPKVDVDGLKEFAGAGHHGILALRCHSRQTGGCREAE